MRPPRVVWRPLRHLRIYRALGVIAIAVMLALSLLPIGGVGPALPHGDKLQHALAYLLLAGGYAQLLEGWRSRAWLAASLLLLGVLVEGLQSLTPWRSAELADLLANSVGITLGLLLTVRRGSRLLEALEQRDGRAGTT
ncbi:MAG: VanZ family protein [Xanthomonadales bacterium]|nr:VanZ family protein [Xanthomonadales bacterium]